MSSCRALELRPSPAKWKASSERGEAQAEEFEEEEEVVVVGRPS